MMPNKNAVARLIAQAHELELAGEYSNAYRLMEQCKNFLDSTQCEAMESNAVRFGLWRLAPLWWSTLRHGGLSFRRCQAEDAEFYQQCFSDQRFSTQFNRQRAWRGDLRKALKKSGEEPPLQSGMLMWVIESSSHGPAGLASLSNLDSGNLRAELSIGFPGHVPSTLGIKATLMMLHFALVMMPFNKIYAYVYEDNPQALHNAIRLGFFHEGRLKDHFRIPGQGFVSVDLVGMTRAQLHGNPSLRSLAQRKIGQKW